MIGCKRMLSDKIQGSVDILSEVVGEYDFIRNTSFHPDSLSVIEDYRNVINTLLSIKNMIRARINCENLLSLLLSEVAHNENTFSFTTNQTILELRTDDARMMFFNSYLSTTWSIYDSLSEIVGKMLCVDSIAKKQNSRPQLWSEFVRNGGKSLSSRTSDLIKKNYGWPIAISYAIRNHFIHDGAQKEGKAFLSPVSSINCFEISQEGFSFLEEKVKEEYKMLPEYTLLSDPWPWHIDNLFEMLNTCHREIDKAMSLLLITSVKDIREQIVFLIQNES